MFVQNMVGPGEVDDDLEPETAEECSKYGEVQKVVIYEVNVTASDCSISITLSIFLKFSLQIPEGVPDDEAVRIFVEFKKMDSAIKGNLNKYALPFKLVLLCMLSI